ncbi:hypothetical protein ES708_09247 [subsurface metagenome]
MRLSIIFTDSLNYISISEFTVFFRFFTIYRPIIRITSSNITARILLQKICGNVFSLVTIKGLETVIPNLHKCLKHRRYFSLYKSVAFILAEV